MQVVLHPWKILLHQERGKPYIRKIISDLVKNKHLDFHTFVLTQADDSTNNRKQN